MAEQPIRIEGLAKFTRAVKQVDRNLGKTVRLALNSAAQFIVDKAKPLIPRRTGRAAASVKVASTQTTARISAGGTRAPYYPWLDFGGTVGPGKTSARPFFKAGRYLYPTLGEHRAEVVALAERELAAVAEAAGLDVT
jgi:HK97 gp10 family phage protein